MTAARVIGVDPMSDHAALPGCPMSRIPRSATRRSEVYLVDRYGRGLSPPKCRADPRRSVNG